MSSLNILLDSKRYIEVCKYHLVDPAKTLRKFEPCQECHMTVELTIDSYEKVLGCMRLLLAGIYVECPCKNCLVKTMCGQKCRERLEWFDHCCKDYNMRINTGRFNKLL